MSAVLPSFGLLLDWWLGSDLRASLSSKDVPEDIKARLLAMHEENVSTKEQLKTAQEKLVKARAVCVNFLLNVTYARPLNPSSSNRKTSSSKKNKRNWQGRRPYVSLLML